jgi:oligopeptidase B
MYKKMKLNYLLPLLTIALLASCAHNPVPPMAKKVTTELTMHGDTRVDNYFWMNQRDSNDVLEYLNAENSYAAEIMKGTEKFQDALFEEIKGRMKQQDESVPYFESGYFYYSRFETGKEYPVYCRKKATLDAPEEILLDVNNMAKGYGYFNVRGLAISTDNKILAYGVDTVSRRRYTIYFKNLETGELLDSKIANTAGAAVWANDNKTVFYTVKDTVTLRSNKIFSHSLLDKTAENDALVFEEKDETFAVSVYKSKSKNFIFVTSTSTLSSEYRFLDASNPSGKLSVLQPRERGLEYSVEHFGDKFFITTNLEATNFRLMETPVSKTDKKNWKEVIAHRMDVLLEGIEIFINHLVVFERSKALNQTRVINLTTKDEHYLDFGEEVYTLMGAQNPEFETPMLRFAYTSLTTPFSTYDYNMDTKEKTLLKRTEVLGGYSPDNYETKRLWAKATDGTDIPMSVVYRKGTKADGSNPALIYAYGSYGNSTDAYFSYSRISLLDRGFVYAIAHVRGGQEMGRQWYDDGKLLKKMNTFTDFIACSQFLVDEKYTSPDKLFAQGGSAGGLLMGVIANLRPDLYKGIIAQVPFVDVVTTMLDSSIPLTTAEYDEWGNPNIEEYYQYMKSYSPYDQVKTQNYPNMLVTTGYHDSQVQYFEPAKWVAKLREMKTDNNTILFKTDMESGHGGASGRFKPIKDVSFQYAFMFKLLGINK